jgi:chlorite dismutase
MSSPLVVAFAAGNTGAWTIQSIKPVAGKSLPHATRLDVVEGSSALPRAYERWRLRGVTSHVRYTHRAEVDALATKQEGLGRAPATCAALIPIRKSAEWWAMAQDERRIVLEEQSRHIAIGMEYLPPVARRLHHCRDLAEPFDFLTWFEFSPEHGQAFEELLQRLRQSREWEFVEREVDIRLSR